MQGFVLTAAVEQNRVYVSSEPDEVCSVSGVLYRSMLLSNSSVDKRVLRSEK